MNNKALYIGLGVVALGGVAYFMMRKKTSDAPASDDVETKSAEVSEPTAPTSSAPNKGSALTKDRPAAPTCGCGTGQIPCPNQRCASKTQVAPTVAAPISTAADPLFLKFGITMADFNKMEAKRAEFKEQIRKERRTGRGLMGGSIELMKRLSRFAGEQGISFGAYRNAKDAEVLLRSQGGAMGSVSPQTDPETENFAFNLTF